MRVKHGKWIFYGLNEQPFLEVSHPKTNNCSDIYLQDGTIGKGEKYFLSKRFSINSFLYEICDDSTDFFGYFETDNVDLNDHPFMDIIKEKGVVNLDKIYSNTKPRSRKPAVNDNGTVDYVDPSEQDDFRSKNNCSTRYKEYENIFYCPKSVDNFKIILLGSRSWLTLRAIQIEEKPTASEIMFFYQTFESKNYKLEEIKKKERNMAFSIHPKLIRQIKKNKDLYYKIIEVLEQEYFEVDNFSGLSAFEALDKVVQ